jgi:hypothetical protein
VTMSDEIRRRIQQRNEELLQGYQPVEDIKNAKDVPELADALAGYLLDMYGDEIEREQLDVDIAWLVAERSLSGEDAALFNGSFMKRSGSTALSCDGKTDDDVTR